MEFEDGILSLYSRRPIDLSPSGVMVRKRLLLVFLLCDRQCVGRSVTTVLFSFHISSSSVPRRHRRSGQVLQVCA